MLCPPTGHNDSARADSISEKLPSRPSYCPLNCHTGLAVDLFWLRPYLTRQLSGHVPRRTEGAWTNLALLDRR